MVAVVEEAPRARSVCAVCSVRGLRSFADEAASKGVAAGSFGASRRDAEAAPAAWGRAVVPAAAESARVRSVTSARARHYHRAIAVGEHPAQPDGRLQFGARPVEAAGAQGQHPQLVVEVGLLGDLTGEPRGLLAVPQAALPGAPVQCRGERRGGRTGEQHGRAGVPALPAAGQYAHRGQRHIGLGGGPLGRHRGVPGPPGVVLGDGVRPCGGAVRVAGRRQLVLDGGGEPVVAMRPG